MCLQMYSVQFRYYYFFVSQILVPFFHSTFQIIQSYVLKNLVFSEQIFLFSLINKLFFARKNKSDIYKNDGAFSRSQRKNSNLTNLYI
ncbi:hypothetical protein BpHYR1_042288 [Brachionus plicatilis]|uniref:Uncharacterized protein n=1 Tax=Brachionus plicatilis TaxID=10195 RepID=A0A3M7R5M3_BRAPC|nr:hypothetical protein BpHYR1_042288 [Brachionus plicatilis]